LPTHQSTWQWVDEKRELAGASKVVKEKKNKREPNFRCLISRRREWNGMENEKIRLQPSRENGRDTHYIQYHIISHSPMEWMRKK
jgi:hypothetical protein